MYKSWQEEFPSPCGDYGSYQKKRLPGTKITQSGFRPLAGIMVLIHFVQVRQVDDLDAQFPSPCGDYGSYRRPALKLANTP